jgi:hypothetical protein
MNASFALRLFVCCIALAAQGSMAGAREISVSDAGDKNVKQVSSLTITTSNNRPFDPVPEPSTGSLILLGLGCVGLAMKLRKRA